MIAGASDVKCALGSGGGEACQGSDGAGHVWAANVRNMGADDGAAEGGAAESRAAVRRADITGQIRKRLHTAAGRTCWKDLAVSERHAALSELTFLLCVQNVCTQPRADAKWFFHQPNPRQEHHYVRNRNHDIETEPFAVRYRAAEGDARKGRGAQAARARRRAEAGVPIRREGSDQPRFE